MWHVVFQKTKQNAMNITVFTLKQLCGFKRERKGLKTEIIYSFSSVYTCVPIHLYGFEQF